MARHTPQTKQAFVAPPTNGHPTALPGQQHKCPTYLLRVVCGLGPDFGAQPLYIQQQYLSTEAHTIRMYDSGGTPSTVSLSSRPEDFHLQALPKPCMTLSSHTAPDVRPFP